jgi:type I restriction enzyme S subunit
MDISEDGYLKPGGVFLSEEAISDYLLSDGDFLISRSGTVGRSFLYRRGVHGPCAYAGYLVRFVPNASVIPAYIFQYTKTASFRDFLRVSAIASTIENVNGEKYANTPLPLPPVAEQASIVRFLNDAGRRIGGYIRVKRRLIELTDEQRQALVHSAITRGIDPNVTLKPTGSSWFPEIPSNWTVIPLRRLIRRTVDGPHHSPHYVDEGVPFLSARNIKVDQWSLSDVKYISEADFNEFSKRVVPERGDVLYTKGGTTGVARVVDLDFRFQVWVHVAVLKLQQDKVDPHYLALTLNSPRCYEQAQLFTRGATNQDLGLNRMKDIVLPVPSLDEQRVIVEALEESLSRLRACRDTLERGIEMVNQYRTRLVTDVVTGKLDVREAAAKLPDELEELAALDEAELLEGQDVGDKMLEAVEVEAGA